MFERTPLESELSRRKLPKSTSLTAAMETSSRYLSHEMLPNALIPLILEETANQIKLQQIRSIVVVVVVVFFFAETAQLDHPENYLGQIDFYCNKRKNMDI